MASVLHVSDATSARTKQRAFDDAKNIQACVIKECINSDTEPPPYVLSELIGKGSFGRVYKATKVNTGRLVAIKIISIEEGDRLHPGAADTFKDILNELNTLKLLSDNGAKNVNTIIDSFLFGQSVWMVTEYCAGGSVATLMRPTKGLPEKWIIPILREVAEALCWVHKHGIIHRDIKCANVFITETGQVQLGDFGVAGIIETKFDKRSTITGTLPWMAPELFDASASYSMEVDIWAFGSMAYEVATGLPPNAVGMTNIDHFGSYLRENAPRLGGDQYSSELTSFVTFCIVTDPSQRPRIGQVQDHPYIKNTSSQYPTASLSKLVNEYRLWETQGGSRQSLFSAGGAPTQTDERVSAEFNDWDFGTMDESEFNDARAVQDAYNVSIDRRPQQSGARPRRRPRLMKHLTIPLEKAFDPKVDSNYADNVASFYSGQASPPPSNQPKPTSTSESNLLLRDNPNRQSDRLSLIDLDASLDGNDLAHFVDLETIRAKDRSSSGEAIDRNHHRQTLDWKFPVTISGLDEQRFNNDDVSSEQLPHLKDQVDDANLGQQQNRISTRSLIDLDDSLPSGLAAFLRPSTAGSDAKSISLDWEPSSVHPDGHACSTRSAPTTTREPSIYVQDGIGFSKIPSATSINIFTENGSRDSSPALDELATSQKSNWKPRVPLAEVGHTVPLPNLPSTHVMLGNCSPDVLKTEFRDLVTSLSEHFHLAADMLQTLHTHDT